MKREKENEYEEKEGKATVAIVTKQIHRKPSRQTKKNLCEKTNKRNRPRRNKVK